jgi:DNA-binding NarL/FixJ family response regulator
MVPGSATRVLLVDDDERFAEVVGHVLRDDGYEVVATIGDAAGIADAVTEHTPDVIVLDLVLPDGDGIDIAERLHADHPGIPIVVFSSLFDQRIGRDTLAAGFGYVEKAAGVEALELAIEGAVGLAQVIDLREEIVKPDAGG